MRSSYSSLGPILLAVGLGLMGTVDGGAAEPTSAVVTNTSVGAPAAYPTIAAPVVTPEASTATPVSQPSAGPRVVARVDLSGQQMTVTIDGKPTYTWRISSGARQFATAACAAPMSDRTACSSSALCALRQTSTPATCDIVAGAIEIAAPSISILYLEGAPCCTFEQR